MEPQSQLMYELVRLYRLSANAKDFESRMWAMTDDPELVSWATKRLFGDTGDTANERN